MNEDVQKIIQGFEEISSLGWIAACSNNFSSLGLTFEKKLGKDPDALYFPDYYGTEIKCTSIKSKYPLYLFTVAFDGPTFPEINRLITKYGYYDSKYSDKKVLFVKFDENSNAIVDNKYRFKLEIDKKDNKMYLSVFDLQNHLLEKESYVYLDTIYNHLNVKIQRLALVYADTKEEKQQKYYRYYKMFIYRLKGWETFLELLCKGIVQVSLIARIQKSGIDEGKYRNKSLVFQLPKKNIDMLFKKEYEFCSDKNEELFKYINV